MTLLIWLAASSLVWSGALWLAGRLLQRSPNVSGRMRQAIWRGATLLMIAPWVAAPFVMAFGWGLAPPESVATTAVSTVQTAGVIVAPSAADVATAESAVVADGGTIWASAPAMSLAEIVLLAVVTGWLVRFVMAQLALRNLLGIVMLSRRVEHGVAREALRRWTKRLKLRREPRLRVVQEQHSPFSYGVLQPTVCLPEGLEDKLSRQSLDLVVGHECLHVARGDGWLRPLERLPADVFWFNPFAWLIRRELDVARELAVDEAVVALADSRIAYARTLRDIAGISAGLPTAAPAATMALAGGRNLMLRVNRTLAQAGRKPARNAVFAACLLGLVAAPMAIAQVMIAVPAPPAPPSAPAFAVPPAPQAPEVFAALESPEAPAPLAMHETPPALLAPLPPKPPAAGEQIYTSADGVVRASFAARVTATRAGSAGGHRVRLVSIGPNEKGESCEADLDGLARLDVASGETLARGQAIGLRGDGGRLAMTVRCTDQQDASGQPAFADAPVAPLAPPAPLPPSASPPAPAPPAPAPPIYAPHQAPPAPPTLPATPIMLDGAPHPIVTAPARITEDYGFRPHPFSEEMSLHEGVDIAAAKGALVHSPVHGRVVHAGGLGSRGYAVKVSAPDGVTMTFASLGEIKVQAGDTVAAGQAIGTVGATGLSTGPHVHFEVAVLGTAVDPHTVKGLKLTAN